MAFVESTFTCEGGAGPSSSSWRLQAHVVDLSKPPKSAILSTGIGFLNHMLDQFNSHAQIGISMALHKLGEDACTSDHHGEKANQFATQVDQTQLFSEVGTLLGTEFYRILSERTATTTSSSFGCPLDEALVLVDLQQQSQQGSLDYDLEPYGAFPPMTGRTHLGHMELKPLEAFWTQVALHSKLSVKFQKIRGENAHHIVEASFKAFSRALRNLVDGMDTTTEGENNQGLYGPDSPNAQASIALQRQASVERKTKETSISATLRLDGGLSGTSVSMGLRLLDDFWTVVSHEAWASLQVQCQGDLWIDEHHTAEDVAIALGQVWNTALGDKAGLNRMWSCTCIQNTARVQVILDLSNRPMLTHNLPLLQHSSDLLQDVPVEMLEHVLDSFVVNARMTFQIYVTPSSQDGTDDATLEDAWTALAIALGRAMRYCIMVDQRRAGTTASSKGTLSV